MYGKESQAPDDKQESQLIVPTSVKFKGEAQQRYAYVAGLPLVFLGSIQNNSRCEGEYLALAISKALQEERHVTLLAVDDLYWHNLKPHPMVTEEEKIKLQAKAREMGEDYVRRNLFYICKGFFLLKKATSEDAKLNNTTIEKLNELSEQAAQRDAGILEGKLKVLPIDERIAILNKAANETLQKRSFKADFKLIRWQAWRNVTPDEFLLAKELLGDAFSSELPSRIEEIHKKLWINYDSFLRTPPKDAQEAQDLKKILASLHICAKLLYKHYELEIMQRFAKVEVLQKAVASVVDEFCRRYQTSSPPGAVLEEELALTRARSSAYVAEEMAGLVWIAAKSGIPFLAYPGKGMSFLDAVRLYFTGQIKRPSTGEVFDPIRAADSVMIHVELDRLMATFVEEIFTEKGKKISPAASAGVSPMPSMRRSPKPQDSEEMESLPPAVDKNAAADLKTEAGVRALALALIVDELRQDRYKHLLRYQEKIINHFWSQFDDKNEASRNFVNKVMSIMNEPIYTKEQKTQSLIALCHPLMQQQPSISVFSIFNRKHAAFVGAALAGLVATVYMNY